MARKFVPAAVLTRGKLVSPEHPYQVYLKLVPPVVLMRGKAVRAEQFTQV